MEYNLKSISTAGIDGAIAKVKHYRYLNEPEDAESICRDILVIDAQHQLALRLLGLAITDQFIGASTDRYRNRKKPSKNSPTATNGCTTRESCTKPSPRSSFTLVTRPAYCPCWTRAGECFGEAEKIRPPAMTIRSCAGTAACVWCKIPATLGKRNSSPSTLRTCHLRRTPDSYDFNIEV